MKIGKCKKELARIISEHGGWRDGYGFSAQDGDDCAVWFYDNAPVRSSGAWWVTSGSGLGHCGVEGVAKLPNWHQTILSRDEYFHLYPEPEAKPTIDQLLQDWRNADDYAKRKQAEADEAAAMRDERWNAVQARAGEIGVTVGRCDSATKADQKLVITDWRDLKSGDVVMVVCSSNPAWKSIDGDELVVRIDGDSCEDVYFGPWCMSDNTDWVFIRRP